MAENSYFKVPKLTRGSTTHYFISKISNKRSFQQIASSHSSDIAFKAFMKLCKDYTKEPFLFLRIVITLPSDNPLRFMKKAIIKWLLATNRNNNKIEQNMI